MANKNPPSGRYDADSDPFKDCVLTKMVREGKHLDYSYPDNGLPKLVDNPDFSGDSPFIAALKKEYGDWMADE